MAGYMISAVVSAHLDALATTYPNVCTRSGPADWAPGTQGGKSGYVKIAVTTANSPANRWPVLITGGVHARELAPPDALVSFLEKLLAAYAASSAITYPAWTDPVSGIVYDSFTIPWPWVRGAVENLDLYVAPLVNDDGRDFVLATLPAGSTYATQELHKMWRKNRAAAPAGVTDPHGTGVDINRNFDILWDFTKYYDMSLPDIDIASSTDPLDDTYIGSAAESEPETKNVANLMRNKGVGFYLDVHAFGRDVMYSWGLETNQSTDMTQSFTNRAWDGKRDGTNNATYKEYIPSSAAAAAAAAAQHISDQILVKAGGSSPAAQARSKYDAKQSADMYGTTGASDDYCFSRWFAPLTGGTAVSPVMAFTLEVGGDPAKGPDYNEGGFGPDYVKHYSKLEREIHVAAWAFLAMAAGTNFVPAASPPTPTPPPATSGSSCLMLLVALAVMIVTVLTALVVA
jgi:murein tripeptide amidase MpaA